MDIVQVSNHGQITIPASVLRKLGLRDGDRAVMREENGRLYLEKLAFRTGERVGWNVSAPDTRESGKTAGAFRRTGLAREAIRLPDDFDERFSDMDREIAAMFEGNEDEISP